VLSGVGTGLATGREPCAVLSGVGTGLATGREPCVVLSGVGTGLATVRALQTEFYQIFKGFFVSELVLNRNRQEGVIRYI
jgi:hypothetical protein